MSHLSFLPVIAESSVSLEELLSLGQDEWVYYSLCALFFVLSGLACGYFIWRKGHMQMLDAELEVQRTNSELTAARDDLTLEERELAGTPKKAES